MTNASLTARNLNKSAYFFSISSEDQKVSHSSTVPKDAITKEFNAKLWMAKVIEVLGGRVSIFFSCVFEALLIKLSFFQGGGKDDSSQGVGTDASKISEAIEVATKFVSSQ